MKFVRPRHRARPRHRDGMAPAGATLGGQQVVPAVALVEMRRFGEADRRPGEDRLPFADQPLLAPANTPAARSRQTGSARAGDPRACSPGTSDHRRHETARDRSRCCSGRSGRTSRRRCSGSSPGSCENRAATRLARQPPTIGRSASRRCRSDRTARRDASGMAPRCRTSRDHRACRADWRAGAAVSADASARGRVSDGSARPGTTRRSMSRCSSRRRRERSTDRD